MAADRAHARRTLAPGASWAEMRRDFRWRVPERFNLAAACCDAWASDDPARVAIRDILPDGTVQPVTFGQLRAQSRSLAAALSARGVTRGDRIAILLPQGSAVAVAHLAAFRLGAVSVPMAALFGTDALRYRLADAAARVLVTDAAGLTKLRLVEPRPSALEVVVSTDGPDRDALDWHALLRTPPDDLPEPATAADDPAMMIYTSGTTGQPKGALHAHRVLLGHLPGVEMPHEGLPLPGDVLWTPADWAWAGGLLNVLLPGLYFGVPIVARKFEKFDPEAAWALMAAERVRNIFVPPTALRLLRSAAPPRGRHALALRTVASGGETLGEETFAWGREALGLTINEFYGQTECNLVLASSAALGVSRPGFIGKPVPGHDAAVIRPDGARCEPGETGQIAIRRPDPVMFLSYWNKPEATKAKFLGDWLVTGDQGETDADGYIRFVGRDDDIITSSGYRIGPGEIEECLIAHPAVALAAAVGKPDALRTEIVKAFVVLRDEVAPSPALAEEIQAFVRKRLSAHEYPREIEFLDELPMTTTGKVIRRVLRDR